MEQRIWAKSGRDGSKLESLAEHTINCINVAEKVINNLPYSTNEKKILLRDVTFALALHDVGKGAVGFQDMLLNKRKNWNQNRHEIISTVFGSEFDEITEEILFAILTHHKTISDNPYTKGCLPPNVPVKETGVILWKNILKEWLKNRDLFLKEWQEICNYIDKPSWIDISKQTKLEKINLPFSWISNEQVKEIPFEKRKWASIIRAITVTSDHMGSARVTPYDYPTYKDKKLVGYSLRPFQEKCLNTVGNAICWAPTGSGKTEAALLWAQKNWRQNGRLYYVLPYTASINAMYERLKPIFNINDSNINYVGMLHSRATEALYELMGSDDELNNISEKEKQAMIRQMASLSREAWFPIRVCTPHQILKYALKGKGWEQMLLEYPNACFIFDEVHAYNPRIVGYLLSTVKLLSKWGARFLFLSATMPNFLKSLIYNQLEGNISYIRLDDKEKGDFEILNRSRHNLIVTHTNLIEDFNNILSEVNKRNSTLIICNHVDTAQKLFKLFSEELEDVQLLHSRFVSLDRNRIEKQLKNNMPKLLIATQVVEVSLDIDFDIGFSEPAPIDAIIQRMGRVNRKGEKGVVPFVLYDKQVNPHDLYQNETNNRVTRTLEELSKLTNPLREIDLVDASNRVYEAGYQGEDEEKYLQALNSHELVDFEHYFLSGSSRDWLDNIFDQEVDRVSAVPEFYLNEFIECKKEGLWLKAELLTLPVKYSLAKNNGYFDKSLKQWVIKREYSPGLGLFLD